MLPYLHQPIGKQLPKKVLVLDSIVVSHPDGSERKISIGKRLPNKELVLDSTVVSSPHGSERKISIVFFCFSLRYDLKCPLIGR